METKLVKFARLLLALAIGSSPCFITNLIAATPQLPLTQFVNPLIGTAPCGGYGWAWDTGNVFPGAVCPRGMVAWSPDTTHASRIAGGYWYPDGAIEDFSLTHFSGRGVVCYKDIPFLPLVQPVINSPGINWSRFAASFSHTNENAAPGYYRVKFDDGIETELTATPRTGMARFAFPAGAPATLLIRADGSVAADGNEVTGFHDAKISGGKRPYTVYFAARFDHSFQTARTWLGNKIHDTPSAQGKTCGAILTFDTASNPIVKVRVGISYVSIADAEANLAAENPDGTFDSIRQKADTAWNTVLNRIQIEGGTDAQKQSFYTALYHCFIHPNLLDDVNGQYPGMDGKIHSVKAGRHQYQNIPAWDEHRSLAPLIAILTPKETGDIVQSLVNYAQQDAAVRPNGGGLPRWEQVNHNSGGMIGDGDDDYIASAYALGVTNFDARAAMNAMDKGASQPGTTSDGFEVRSGLADYEKLGYVPDQPAVTLEYCGDDFALSQFARALGDRETSEAYLKRAQNWKNIFNASTKLIRPRNADGTWMTDFSATTKKGYVEGTAEQYVWLVNFNLRGLIVKMGGNEKVVARLDKFFTRLNSGVASETAYMGNEPCEETPWIFDFAGAPAHTQAVVRRIQNGLFLAQPSGLPGNDDAGALSSWFVFSALGLYPEIPGVAGFVTGSPLFPKATVHLGNGAVIQIIGDHATRENCYVQKLKLNGKNYGNLWIPWSALSNGAVLNFSLGEKPSSWGNNSPPPSFDTVKSQ